MVDVYPPVSVRSYTTNPASKYILPSDEGERERLQNQHLAVKALYGSQFLPEELHLNEGDKILDAGAGSGAWALDLAPTLPDGVEIIGCDIESKAFPDSHPSNTIFTICSVLDLPANWSDAFSLAHQRSLVAALTLSQWSKALSELLRVTKPGGWIRLEEPDMGLSFPIPQAEVERRMPLTCDLYRAIKRTFDARDLVWDVALRLPDMLREAGFVDVKVVSTACPVGPRDAPPHARELLEAFYRAIKPPSQNKELGLNYSDAEWTSFLDGVHEEILDNGCHSRYSVFTARKSVPIAK